MIVYIIAHFLWINVKIAMQFLQRFREVRRDESMVADAAARREIQSVRITVTRTGANSDMMMGN
jgi:hypothetical protein